MKRYKNYGELVGGIEEAVTGAVQRNDPRAWVEDAISYEIARNLRMTLDGASVGGLDRSFRVACDVFKVRGNLESEHGDIALLVQFRSWDGHEISGVAFLEAKKRYKNGGEYRALDPGQMTRIMQRSPFTQLLLYSYEPIAGFEDNIRALAPGRWTHNPLFQRASSYAVAVPMNTALALGTKSTVLHRFGVPLSLQLAGRYLRGFDLDFSTTLFGRVSRYANEEFGEPPRYVVVVGVGSGEEESPEPPIELLGDGYDEI